MELEKRNGISQPTQRSHLEKQWPSRDFSNDVLPRGVSYNTFDVTFSPSLSPFIGNARILSTQQREILHMDIPT